MQKLSLILTTVLLGLAALGSGMTAHGASFTATLDRDAITLGEQATLSLTFEGGQPQQCADARRSRPANSPRPALPKAVSFINGAMSSTVTVNFP